MTTTTIFTIPEGETFQSFAQLNNFLIVITDHNRYYLLWDQDEESYTELESMPIPLMQFEKNIVYEDLRTETIQEGDYVGNLNPATVIEFQDAVDLHIELKSRLDGLINSYKPSGVIRGMVLLRFAYKLFDGTYVNHSMPYYVNVRADEDISTWVETLKIVSEINYGDATWDWYWDKLSMGDLKYIYKYTLEQAATLAKYKNIIQSLDIFMTNPVIDKDPDSYFCQQDDTETYNWIVNDGWEESSYIFNPPTNSVGQEEIRKEPLYYKILEVSIETLLDTPQPAALIDLPLKVAVNIESLETLPIDNFTHHTIWGSKNYNYNSKLHFGDITTKFFNGFYPFRWEYDNSELSTETYRTKTYIKTESGDKIVYNTFITPLMRTQNDLVLLQVTDVLTLAQMICYPDARAYKIEIQRESAGDFYTGDAPSIFASIPLIPHPYLNLAYYDTFMNIDTDYYLSSIETHYTDTYPDYYAIELDNLDEGVAKPLFNDINRVQISKVDNPLSLPAINSYQIGNDDESVIGFGSVVEPLSDGQFGQFPLYVFTTAGIFVMEQGDNEILYSNILPINKEVCNSPESITDIGGGVLYATEKGLNILSGKQITEISELLKGYPKQYLVNDTSYKAYLNDPYLVELLSDISTVDFLTYLEDAIMAYDYKNKEIIVTNDTYTYTYSYVFGIETNTWHKVNYVFSEFVILVPDTLGLRDGILYSIKDELVEYSETLLQTRPLKLGSLGRKSIERLVLRGMFNVADLTYSGLYMFGSLDGKSYKFLGGKNPQDNSTFNDILLKRTHYNVEFLILVFAGQLDDSSINFIELTYFDKWQNKLR